MLAVDTDSPYGLNNYILFMLFFCQMKILLLLLLLLSNMLHYISLNVL